MEESRDSPEAAEESVTVSGHPRSRPERVRDSLAVALTLVTGATDAIGFTRLGGVFTSVMTGNMVLLGVSAGKRDSSLALHTGAAFAGYVVGSLLGARLAGQPTSRQTPWPRRVTTALGVELVTFLVFAVWWELTSGRPGADTTYVLLGINALALGIQSSAVLRLGIDGLSTTYLTGTLTQLMAAFANRTKHPSTRSVAILIGIVCGAALGAVLAIEVPRAAPVAPVGILMIVVVIAWTTHRKESHRAPA
jgi:uncharacterized membrane protein YoaK (UPF0700 family)